jgi:hypothetical protein
MATKLVAPMRVDSYDRSDVVLERDAVAELNSVGGVPLARVYHFERSVRDALRFRPGSVQKLRGSLQQLVDSPRSKAEPAAIERVARGIIAGESEPAERLLDDVAEWVMPASRRLPNLAASSECTELLPRRNGVVVYSDF